MMSVPVILFGHGMLHLHARVHFHEIELAALVKQELDRAGVAIIHGLDSLDRGFAHGGAKLVVKRRRRGLFEKLLMATLDGAVTFAQSHMVAEIVCKNLNLDMARTQHELLEIHIVIAESSSSLGLGSRERAFQVFRPVHFAHALTAAACGSLNQNGILDGLGECAGVFDRFHHTVRAGNRRNPARRHGLTSNGLIAHALDAFGSRAYENKVVLGACTGEIGVFGQEAVAGMHRFAARGDCGRNDIGHDQVGLSCRSRSDANRLVGIFHRQRVLIRRRIDRDRFHAKFAGGTHDAQRDLSAVGNQNLFEHAYSPSPASAAP